MWKTHTMPLSHFYDHVSFGFIGIVAIEYTKDEHISEKQRHIT